MLTLKDCLGLCELCEEGVRAIAEHEQLPEIVALGMAACLVQTADGLPRIKQMIQEDIEKAKYRNNNRRVKCLERALERVMASHPDYCEAL
jgi:hypothetical protein